MTKRTRETLRTIAPTAAVIAAAVLCRVCALYLPDGFFNKLANFLRVFLYLGLFAVWGVSVRRRVVQAQVRRYLTAVALLMILWLTIREFKWHLIVDPTAIRWLWYAYYIPMLLIPLLSLLVSMSLGRPEQYRLPRAAALLYVPTAAFVLLVLTNDLHQAVFSFPPDAVWTELNAVYGTAWYLLAVWGVGCALAAFAVMLIRARGTRRWLPALPFAAAVVYLTLYALQTPLVRAIAADLAVAFCLLFTWFFESCIRCGLIQSNIRYFDLFRASMDIDAQITDRDYNVRYAALCSAPVPKDVMRRAEQEPVILPEGKRVYNLPVSGGHAVWTEDVSELLSLRETLEDRREELTERNALLQYEYEREREHAVVAEQNRLYDLLQSMTQTQLDRIERLTAAYGETSDDAEKRRILAQIAVLGSYIKRRKDFVLTVDATPTVPESKLTSALDESFRALALLGVRGGFFVRTGREFLPGALLERAYDFFEDVTESVLDSAQYISVRVCPIGGALRVSVLTDGGGELPPRKYPAAKRVEEEDGASFLLPLEGGDAP
ncbi:MAG: hypothetical protein IJT18_01470 [Oscillospiraceae bacterium]|nr:hypothetical protein [Oscillospiraceae bacterium]